MNNHPLVSIIVPVYNIGEKLLSRCLDSLLNQDYENYEILLIDDCSTDDSSHTLSRYASSYPDKIRLLTMSENSGSGKVRDFGISQAKGKYAMFVDGDDFVSSRFISIPLFFIEKYGVDTVQFRHKVSYSDNDLPEDLSRIVPSEIDFKIYNVVDNGLTAVVMNHSSLVWDKIIRLDIIKNNGIKSPRRIHQDTALISKYAVKTSSIAIIECPLIYYFQRSNSMVHKMLPWKVRETIYSSDEVMQAFIDAGLDSEFIQQGIEECIRGVLFRMSGMTKQELLEISDGVDPAHGVISMQISKLLSLQKKSHTLFYLARIKRIGIIKYLRSIIVRNLKR